MRILLFCLMVLALVACADSSSRDRKNCIDFATGRGGQCSCMEYKDGKAFYRSVTQSRATYCLRQPNFNDCLCGSNFDAKRPN